MEAHETALADDLHAAARLAWTDGSTQVAFVSAVRREMLEDSNVESYLAVAVRNDRDQRLASWIPVGQRLGPHVTSLAVIGLETSGAGLTAILRGFPHLDRLILRSVGLHDEDLRMLAVANGQLVELDLTENDIGDPGVFEVVTKQRDLQVLHLRRTRVTERGLVAIVNRLSDLQVLDVRGCTELSVEAIARLEDEFASRVRIVSDPVVEPRRDGSRRRMIDRLRRRLSRTVR